MDLDFTKEQDLIREEAANFFKKECPFDKVKELEEKAEGYSPETWKKMTELGWLCLGIAEEYGGDGDRFLDTVIFLEEAGKTLFTSPFFSTVVECGQIIGTFGSDEQKKSLLERIMGGELIMALAQYETDGSYELADIQMAAEQTDDQYALSGKKLFVMDANVANSLIVLAQTTKGLTLFLVDTKSVGLKINKMPTIGKDNTCEVVFESVQVSEDQILGKPGINESLLRKLIARAAVAKAAEMVGGCRACVEMTSAYAKERVQYEKPIGGFQVIQHYLANMLMETDTSWSYLYKVASMIDKGQNFEKDASALKACVNEAYKFVSERSVQIHGGIGTTREGDIGLFFRKAKSMEYMCGDTEHHTEALFERMLEEDSV